MELTAGARPPAEPAFSLHGTPVRWGIREVALGIGAYVVLFVVAPLPLTAPFLAFGSESAEYYTSALVVSMLADVGLVVAAAWLTFGRNGGSWESLGFRRPRWSTLGWAAAAFLGAFAASSAYSAIVSALGISGLESECTDQLPQAVLDNGRLVALAAVVAVVFAPVCEETFFRGFLFPGIARAWGLAPGIVLSGLIFSSAHLGVNIHKTIIPIALVGAVFAYSYWRSGNIISTMAAHFTFNVISFSYLAAECLD
jgi:membrane protease YdiL (CAAX protease family)